LDNISHGRKVSLQGNDGFSFNPIHVADASKAVIASVEKTESSTINIAGPDVLSIRKICKAAGSHMGIQPVFESIPGKALSLIGDIGQMKKRLYSPTIRLLDRLYELTA
ncbi:MAG: hypothetical protein EDM79_19515, partial [Chloroflexi bacterium]